MRIPITKADWPCSFNATSKYIGRHWPKGKLNLSVARENTARLMGYNSVHDLQQELLETIPDGLYDIQAMSSSMAVKSVLMYEFDPLESLQFFSKIPWTNLKLWKSTLDYNLQQIGVRLESNGTSLLTDEFHSMMNYTTPVLVAGAYSKGQIPPYEFTVDKDGLMFHRATFECLFELVKPDEQSISECGQEISVEEYFNKFILPLAHGPVESIVPLIHPDKPMGWLTPPDIDVLKVTDGRFVLLNKELDAFYPGAYDKEGLLNAIKQLFMLRVIPDLVTKCQVPANSYGIGQEEVSFGMHGTFKWNDQVFYRRNALNSYHEITSKPLFEYLFQKLRPTQGLNIPDSIISAFNLAAINKAKTVNQRILNSFPQGKEALSQLDITNVLSPLYGGVFYGDETLSENENFDLSDRHFVDEDDQLEAEKEVREYTAFCESLGKDVLLCMPELKPYYSERVIGHYFHESYQEDSDTACLGGDEACKPSTKADRHLDFFIFLLTDHLCIEFEESSKGIAYQCVSWLLVAIRSNHIEIEQFKDGFTLIMSVCEMFNNDKDIFSRIEIYCNRLPLEPTEQYINYGSTYKPTYKKIIDNQSISKLYRMGRKHNLD